MKSYTYSLKTVSSIILSPRQQNCFYLNTKDFDNSHVSMLDYVNTDTNKTENDIKIIYPFYQYGSYDKYKPDNTQYYIPGSSIKGAIHNTNIMVDDVLVDKDFLHLKQLYKVQYLHNKKSEEHNELKQAKYECFFPNVAIEMLYDHNHEFTGNIYSEDYLPDILQEASKQTARKLSQLLQQIEEILKSKDKFTYDTGKKCKNILIELSKNINNYISLIKENSVNNKAVYYLFLGGYKGLLLSSIFQFNTIHDPYAIYIDNLRTLPYGLVQITLKGDL